MKIECTCGHLIVDQTDALKHKGYVVSDVHWFPFWNAVDQAVEETDETQTERACMQLRQQRVFKQAWECTQCGKLYFDSHNGQLVSFSPDSGGYEGVLDQE